MEIVKGDLIVEQVTAPKFPVVIKIGHAHSGVAKVKVDSLADFQVLYAYIHYLHIAVSVAVHNRLIIFYSCFVLQSRLRLDTV